MPQIVLWSLGLFLFGIACVWLVIIPFRLSKGLMHKWGYHAHCGVNCEQFAQARSLQARLDDRFSAGLRQGMRWTVQTGVEQTSKMLREHTLLPEIVLASSGDRNERLGARYNQLVRLMDRQDADDQWEEAITLVLWGLINRQGDPMEGISKVNAELLAYAAPEGSATE